ncbi:MAG: deoxynucleoside kinase [bacterium]
MKKGKLIVIDGTDGTGKQTQTKLLLERLLGEGRTSHSLDFPQYTQNVAGRLLYEALKENKHGDFLAVSPKIASVVYAFDRMESSPQIKEWLDSGAVVILDRYVTSNQIHQGGKIADHEKRKEFIKWLDVLEYGVAKLPRPDVVFYLNVPVEVSLRLIHERAEREGSQPDQAESSEQHLRESQERALSIMSEYPQVEIIDCSENGQIKSREAIHELIYQALQKHL